MNIPKKIFQTHSSLKYVDEHPVLSKAVKSWQKPTYEYHFYDDFHCQKFIYENFDKQIQDAYDICMLPVMKADLWRYCVIYHYGGIYADVDTILYTNPCILTNHQSYLVATPENDTHICQWVFAAPPKSPVLKEVIDLCVSRLLGKKDENLNIHFVHHLTGPGLFTDAINIYLKKMKQNIYDSNDIYLFNNKNFHSCLIKHLFTGQQRNGWIHQRNDITL